jgi:predicted RNA binding protein YcfA (HicA-like mRNA interferase family)
VKVRDLLRRLHEGGWRLVVVEGSHRQLEHPRKTGRLTVAGHPSAEVPPGTLNSILKTAGLR